MFNLTVNASTYEEGKVVQGREMNASYGSLRDVSSFSNSYTREKKSLAEDLGGSLRLPQIGILQILLKFSKSMVYDLS